MIVDLAGSYGSSGTTLTAAVPDRFLDTRDGTGGWLGALGAGQVVQVPIGGANGVPAGATAAVLNVTVTERLQAPGYLVAFPCDSRGARRLEPQLRRRRHGAQPRRRARSTATVRSASSRARRTYVLADLAGWFTS